MDVDHVWRRFFHQAPAPRSRRGASGRTALGCRSGRPAPSAPMPIPSRQVLRSGSWLGRVFLLLSLWFGPLPQAGQPSRPASDCAETGLVKGRDERWKTCSRVLRLDVRFQRRASFPEGVAVGAPDQDVTGLLKAWQSGDLDARDRLLPLVYEELRRRAAAHLRHERANQTLQPTALVHEAYLRLVDQRRAMWQNRSQFLAVASQTMRRLLVDRGRGRRAEKRGGQWLRATLEEAVAATPAVDVDVIDLDEALTRLAAFDPAQEPDRRAPLLRRPVARGDRRGAGRVAGHRRARLAGGARLAVPCTQVAVVTSMFADGWKACRTRGTSGGMSTLPR